MFWSKKTLESAEFIKLFKMVEETRIKVEMMAIELDLTKKKLKIAKGIPDKEEETETNKNPSIFLSPNGTPLKGY